MRAVSFDFGQTLCELDHDLLARRLRNNGFGQLDPELAERETPGAWLAYGQAKSAGILGREAWLCFMRTLLSRSGLSTSVGNSGARDVERAAEWLWGEQPRHNLWRKPIAGMLELVGELGQRGVRVGVLSNSEGRLRELCEEIGVADLFAVIVDSGRLEFEKPDRRIFECAAEGLGVTCGELIHVGDSFEADVLGAVNAGARAVWFKPAESRDLPEGVLTAEDADGVARALDALGLGG